MAQTYGRFAEVYDRLMDDMPYGDWVEWIRECWMECAGNRKPPSLAVELGCGTGSVAIPLAAGGWSVEAMDLSADMIRVAERKRMLASGTIRAGGGSLALGVGDMRDWASSRQAELVYSVCDCMNYLREEADVQAALGNAFRMLAEGGLLLFDMHAPRMLRCLADDGPYWLREDDLCYLWTSEWEQARREVRHELTIFKGRTEDEDSSYERIDELHIQRSYEPEQVTVWLDAVGFRDISIYSDFTFDPPDADTERLFFRARK